MNLVLTTSKILNKLGIKKINLSTDLPVNVQEQEYVNIQAQRCIPWFKDNGDRTLRLEYDLSDSSIVLDLGGYEGQWASDIFSMYCCCIHVFEPVEGFASKIEKRFAKNSKILVHRYGLSNLNKKSQIFIDGDSSSTFKSDNDSEEINLVKAIDFIKEHHIHSVDLMKINIEGGEYDLLEHLLNNGLIENITNIQVQFHDFVPNAENRMIKIQQELEKTHFLTYQYSFVWENWKRKF
jgi:FkbM family methyltransferase